MGLAALWAASACLVAPIVGVIGSVLILYHTLFQWKISGTADFETPYMVFATALGTNFYAVFPLTLVLFGYALAAHRWPKTDRSVAAALLSLLPVSLLCTLGLGSVLGLYFGEPGLWILPIEATGTYAVPIAIRLAIPRLLIPALRPGAFSLCFPPARLWTRPTWRLLIAAGWIGGLTTLTLPVETKLLLDCASGDSCMEWVSCRGLPYPFVQRSFMPMAFLFDCFLIAVLYLPLWLAVWVGRRARRMARP